MTTFRAQVAFLSLVAFATYTSSCYLSYNECMANVSGSKETYEGIYYGYIEGTKPVLKQATEGIQQRLNKLKVPQFSQCQVSPDADTHVNKLIALCGGHRINHPKYAPRWLSFPKLPDPRSCSWIVATQPELCAQVNTTTNIITGCDYMGLFNKSVGTIIDQCPEGF